MTDTTRANTTEQTQFNPEDKKYKVLNFASLPQKYDCVCENTTTEPGFRCFCEGNQKQTQEKVSSAVDTATRETPRESKGVQTKPQMKKTFCTFCYNRRRPASEYKSHFVKSGPEFGAKIVCPLLLSQQCARCGEIGHTPKMCKSKEYLRSYRGFPVNPKYIDFNIDSLSRPMSWLHPIPPALQDVHRKYENEFVKTSRVWILMSGDHTKYTEDFYLCEGGPNWVPYSVKPKTEYETMVIHHYKWMRQHFSSDITRPQRYIVAYPAAPKQEVKPKEVNPIPIARCELLPSDIRDIIKKYTVPKPASTDP
jgi:hypothetical protein